MPGSWVGVSGGAVSISAVAERTGSFTFIQRSGPMETTRHMLSVLDMYATDILFYMRLLGLVIRCIDGLKVKMCQIDADYCYFAKLLALS